MTRVLVVDDDAAIRTLVARVFLRQGYEVDTATDGVEAIEAVDRSRYDLMLLDLMMPRIDGIGVITHLGARNEPIPCIVVMTAAVPDILKRMDRRLIAAVITKPFELAELLRTADDALHRGPDIPD
jgi:two-component system response regulator MprA